MFQKLFTAQQIKEIDNQTVIKQNISSEKLMERAATALFHQLEKYLSKNQSVYIFCGKGNNGGDALVLARLLHLNAYKVKCLSVPFSTKSSADYEVNLKKLQQLNFIVEKFKSGMEDLPAGSVIIDGIFGTGLSRPASGIAQQAIDFINRQQTEVFSIDVPSGLYVDTSNRQKDSIVSADKVFTFQFPKISFFYPENAGYVKDYEVVDIGLEQSVIDQMPTSYFLMTSGVEKMLKKRRKFDYKNTYGHALIAGGSYGMIGAVVLASKAALRIGAGLVTNLLPKCGYIISQTVVPEVMTLTASKKKYLSEIRIPDQITAVGIGMGMGTQEEVVKAFKKFLKNYHKSLLLDADALNILALYPKYVDHVPPQSIMTPHPGEFKRLAGIWKNDTEKWQKLKDFAKEHQVIMVLKGAYTVITDGDYFYINPVANPALATAGSGDVLSGIITGLLAQKYQPLEAALLGVYLHGQTAEKYVANHRDYSMTASDIIQYLTL